jgi:hypothetical protein
MPFDTSVPIDSCAYTSVVKETSSHSETWQRHKGRLLKRGLLEIRRRSLPREEMVASPRASSRPRQFYNPS